VDGGVLADELWLIVRDTLTVTFLLEHIYLRREMRVVLGTRQE